MFCCLYDLPCDRVPGKAQVRVIVRVAFKPVSSPGFVFLRNMH